MRCAVCGEVEGHVVHREHAFDAAIPASKVRALRDGYTETVGQGSYVPMACVRDALDALLREYEGGAK